MNGSFEQSPDLPKYAMPEASGPADLGEEGGTVVSLSFSNVFFPTALSAYGAASIDGLHDL